MLVTMEERKEFWRYERIRKWYRKHLGEHWIGRVLDEIEATDGLEQRKRVGAYLLKMHQIETRMWMEKHPRTGADDDMG